MARSETSRLYDNIGRRIRHLREDLMTTEDEFKRKGIERNIKSLDDFREDLRKLASKNDNKKLTEEQIYEATDRLKTDDNLSTDKRKIDKITMKKVASEPEEFFEQFEDFEDEEIKEIFADFSEVSGKYVGQSGDSTYKTKSLNLIESAKMFKNQNELTDKQITLLNAMIKTLDDAVSGKGADGVVYPVGTKREKNKRRV